MADPGRQRRNPLLGAAVLKALLRQRTGDEAVHAQAIYQGVLRDLRLEDADVERYLVEHGDQVREAIRGHGRRG